MEHTYKFSCSSTVRLTEAIKRRFPTFVGSVTTDSKTPGTTIRADYGISDSDKRTLDEIVERVCLPDKLMDKLMENLNQLAEVGKENRKKRRIGLRRLHRPRFRQHWHKLAASQV
jgi:hypothetical protein